jgi:hypothetical protein
LTEDQVRINIDKLYSTVAVREGKYVRNFNRYNNNGSRREDLWTPNLYPQSYLTPAVGASGSQTQLNIIKSCVDTITSKISQANVRPFFNPNGGDHDTTRACLKLQNFFDIWLDEQHAYPKSVMCFRDAAIFDIGVLYIDVINGGIRRVAPWQYFIDPSEYQAGAVTHASLLDKYCPLASLKDRLEDAELKAKLEENPQYNGPYWIYWDFYHGERWEFFDRKQVSDPVKMDHVQYGGLFRRPFVEIYYTKPLKGFFSTSLIDELLPIQKQIDVLAQRIDAATRNAILKMFFYPKGSSVRPSMIENNVKGYEYIPTEGSAPVVEFTPTPIHAEFISLLEMFIEKAYQLAGISQLSAQSKKPTGLDSGKALDTMEDIESDRFNVQLQQFTHFLVDAARVVIDCSDKNEPILDRKIEGEKVKWGDARKQREQYTIQFSAASALSKDPEEKMKQIQLMLDMDVIDKRMVAKFMQLPDLTGVYTVASASYEAEQRIIDDAIKDGDTDYLEVVDLRDLRKEIQKRLNQMVASGDKEEYIDNLLDLLKRVDGDIKLVDEFEAKTPPMPPPESLDAGQIGALSELMDKVQAHAISAKSAVALITGTLPNIPAPIVDAMVGENTVVPAAPKTQGMNPIPFKQAVGGPNV